MCNVILPIVLGVIKMAFTNYYTTGSEDMAPEDFFTLFHFVLFYLMYFSSAFDAQKAIGKLASCARWRN